MIWLQLMQIEKTCKFSSMAFDIVEIEMLIEQVGKYDIEGKADKHRNIIVSGESYSRLLSLVQTA
jgi:hypothetical protein